MHKHTPFRLIQRYHFMSNHLCELCEDQQQGSQHQESDHDAIKNFL